jgi:4a-hydroxytetrahydrobiopterin dehydratase
MSELAKKSCVPCQGGVPPLKPSSIAELLGKVEGWKVEESHHLVKKYDFPDFQSGLEFVNRVGDVAEYEGHHPDLYLTWGQVEVKIWTHKIDGLTESDFVLAAKIDQL